MSDTVQSRQAWMGLLAQAPLEELEDCWETVAQPAFTWVKRPELGTSMIRARASGTGILFNLSEVTVTRCSLQIDSGEIGVAYVMGRSKRRAALAALLDAVVQRDRVAGIQTMPSKLSAMARAAEDRRANVVQETYGSKVDFMMLSRDEVEMSS